MDDLSKKRRSQFNSNDYVGLELEEPKSLPQSEKKDATVVFADIRGFTTLADCMQPEELVTVLNIYLSTVIETFREQKVLIEKIAGDSIMGVWNIQVDLVEQALRAIKASVDAQRDIQKLKWREASLPRIDFGIGINTGQVIAGGIGYKDSLEYTVIGDAVNVAARISSIVPGGKIWITDNTYQIVENNISIKPLGPMELKGKRQWVKLYEVVDARNVLI